MRPECWLLFLSAHGRTVNSPRPKTSTNRRRFRSPGASGWRNPRAGFPGAAPACFAFACLVTTIFVGCGSDEEAALESAAPAAQSAIANLPRPSAVARQPLGEFHIEAEPFAPTLGKLFSNGQMTAIPAETSHGLLAPAEAEDYAFSAIDGFARVYHFFRSTHWSMMQTRPFPFELPRDGWRVAWNDSQKRLELLVADRQGDLEKVTLFRLAGDRWAKVPTEANPPAMAKARLALAPGGGAWYLIQPDAGDAGEFWLLEDGAWSRIEQSRAPDLRNTDRVVSYPPGPGLALLTTTGELWLWAESSWSKELTLPADEYAIFHYDASISRLVLGQSAGIGQTSIQTALLARGSSELGGEPTAFKKSDLVVINEEVQGYWKGVGRVIANNVTDDATEIVFEPGLDGTQGELALALENQDEVTYWTPSGVDSIEFAPQFSSLLWGRGAYVPSLEGYLVVSDEASGRQSISGVRFPYVGDVSHPDYEKIPPETRSTVRRRHSRFWLFQDDGVEWIKPYSEIHPDLDFQLLRTNPLTEIYEFLSWSYPEAGYLQYTYRRKSPTNLQWTHSPVLTLHGLPEPGVQEGEGFWTIEPTLWGHPAEIVQAGWVGKLGEEIQFEEDSGSASRIAYREVPDRGFIARTSALTPEVWTSANLPINFGVGVKLVSDPVGEALYLLGGWVAVHRRVGGARVHVLEPNREVWRWTQEGWSSMTPDDPAPIFGSTAAFTFDPFRHQLLVLNTETLLALKSRAWTTLWKIDEGDELRIRRRPAVFVHPLSGQIIGAWTGFPARIALWDENFNLWVRPTERNGAAAPIELQKPSDVFPSIAHDGFSIAESEILDEIRSNSWRDGSGEAESYAYGLSLVFDPRPPAEPSRPDVQDPDEDPAKPND